MKKKTKKQEVDYKKVALYIAAAVFVLTTIILIKEALLANRPKNSEILSLGNVKISEYKSKRAVITNYNDYKSFLEEYSVFFAIGSVESQKDYDYLKKAYWVSSRI